MPACQDAGAWGVCTLPFASCLSLQLPLPPVARRCSIPPPHRLLSRPRPRMPRCSPGTWSRPPLSPHLRRGCLQGSSLSLVSSTVEARTGSCETGAVAGSSSMHASASSMKCLTIQKYWLASYFMKFLMYSRRYCYSFGSVNGNTYENISIIVIFGGPFAAPCFILTSLDILKLQDGLSVLINVVIHSW